MIDDILTESEILLKNIDRINKFGEKYNVIPFQETDRIVKRLYEFAGSLPDITIPNNQDELIQSELKRRLFGSAFLFEQGLTSGHLEYDKLLTIYGIPKQDLDGLKSWLLENRKNTLEAIEGLYKKNKIDDYELSLSVDIPNMRRQSEEFATVYIQNYHKTLGKFLQDLTQVGEFLRDITAVPTTSNRSYFHTLTNTLAISIPNICFSKEDGGLQLRERDLITLYGHEGMGHALNQVITKNNKLLPYFLSIDSLLTKTTSESVAQFYQQVIFEDLKNSQETQKKLGIQHKFNEIYQESKEIAQLNEYTLKLNLYAITVLADRNLGSNNDEATLKKRADLLCEVTLSPSFPWRFVEQNRYRYDSKGNLLNEMVCELVYCAQPVKRALEEFAKQGIHYEGKDRSKIDATLLTGFWTPIGYVDNARLKAQEK